MKRTSRIKKLVLPKYKQIPEIPQPSVHEVRECVTKEQSQRTENDVQLLYRFFLLCSDMSSLMNDPSDLMEMSKFAKYRRISKNDVLFFEGDESDNWFCIISGTASVIVRLFLIAEDCLLDSQSDEQETLEYAPLVHAMDLDIERNKLRKVCSLKKGDVFAYHSFIVEQKRASTIVCTSDVLELIELPKEAFVRFCLAKARSELNDKSHIIRTKFTELRDDQVQHIALYSRIKKIEKSFSITKENTLGRNVYIILDGKIWRSRNVDFTPVSFKTIPGAFETLELKFPAGNVDVHTDDLEKNDVFIDPIIGVEELYCEECPATMKAETEVTLLAMDYDYFSIIVGAYPFERIKQSLKSSITSDEIIKIWYEKEKAKLWNNFKKKEAHKIEKELYGISHAYDGTSIVREYTKERCPTSFSSYRKKKIVPKCSSHLSARRDYSEPMEY